MARAGAHLAIRHDAYRFMPPSSPRYVGKDVVRYFWPDENVRRSQAAERKDSAEIAAELDIAAERDELLRLKRELAAIKFELKFRRFLDARKYSPDQPRVLAGNPDGGQWTANGGGQGTAENGRADRIRVAQLGGTVTDADGTPYYKPGGHHEMPKGVYEKWNLRPETEKVFREATTGTIPRMTARTTPDGVPVGNAWSGQGGAHGIYNEAIQELSDRFLEKNNIKPESMTPNQARTLLKEIRETEDPRIRNFNATMRLLRRLFPLRGGRGTE
jgi:hypothetical protein